MNKGRNNLLIYEEVLLSMVRNIGTVIHLIFIKLGKTAKY